MSKKEVYEQKAESILLPIDLAIAVERLAFQHLLAVAVKGVLLVLVVAVRFQVLTSLRAGRQFFSSPFAHYSFTSGPVWPVFWIDPLVSSRGKKPLSIAVEELYKGKVKIVSDDELDKKESEE